jgi:hypothetical protein
MAIATPPKSDTTKSLVPTNQDRVIFDRGLDNQNVAILIERAAALFSALLIKLPESIVHLLVVSAPVIPTRLVPTSTLNAPGKARREHRGGLDLLEFSEKSHLSRGLSGSAQFIRLNTYDE